MQFSFVGALGTRENRTTRPPCVRETTQHCDLEQIQEVPARKKGAIHLSLKKQWKSVVVFIHPAELPPFFDLEGSSVITVKKHVENPREVLCS